MPTGHLAAGPGVPLSEGAEQRPGRVARTDVVDDGALSDGRARATADRAGTDIGAGGRAEHPDPTHLPRARHVTPRHRGRFGDRRRPGRRRQAYRLGQAFAATPGCVLAPVWDRAGRAADRVLPGARAAAVRAERREGAARSPGAAGQMVG